MKLNISFIERPFFFHTFLFLVFFTYWLIRIFAFSALGDDEAEQVLFAQSFSWGYGVSNPPLYTWVLIALTSLFGNAIGVVLAFKLFVLLLVYYALHYAARLSLGPDRTLDVVLIALSPFLLFLVAWQSILNYSHSLLNALFVILTYVTVLKIVFQPGARWYLALGAALGLGMLTKYSFGLFVLALLGAGLTMRDVRSNLLSWKLSISVCVALAILAPHAWWLAQQAEQLQEAVNYKLQIDDGTPYLVGVGKGLWNIVRAFFAFMSPLWIIALALFPSLMKPRQSHDRPLLADGLLGRTFLGVIVLMAAMVVFGGITQFRPNYLFLMILFPVWMFARLPVKPQLTKRRYAYGALALACAALTVIVLLGKAILDPYRCNKCQLLIPYAEIAQELKERGFLGGTVYTNWYPAPLAGNLVPYLDNARIISSKFHYVRPDVQTPDDQCMVVWWPPEQKGQPAEVYFRELRSRFGATLEKGVPTEKLVFPLHRSPEKKAVVEYVIFDPGTGECR